MDTVSIADFRRAPMDAIKIKPIEITADGKHACYIVGQEDVVVVSDLHPRVRNMIRAMEKKARAGMVTKKLTVADLKTNSVEKEPSKES